MWSRESQKKSKKEKKKKKEKKMKKEKKKKHRRRSSSSSSSDDEDDRKRYPCLIWIANWNLKCQRSALEGAKAQYESETRLWYEAEVQN